MKLKIALSVLCLGMIAGPVHAWDPIKDLTGKPIHKHHQDLANSMEKFRSQPLKYVERRGREVLEDVCSVPARIYVGAASGGTLRSIPQWFINRVQPYYSVDLRGVRYSENANVNGSAVAVTDKGHIYVKYGINWNNSDHQRLMLHEFEHVVQYKRLGHGRSRLQCKYVLDTIRSGFQHDDIRMEQAADRKANFVISKMRNAMTHNYSGTFRSVPTSNNLRRLSSQAQTMQPRYYRPQNRARYQPQFQSQYRPRYQPQYRPRY